MNTSFVIVHIYRYLICVNTHMKELKPFGDVPKKLSMEVKRSFVATRTFTQALNTGRDVVTKMQSVCHTFSLFQPSHLCVSSGRVVAVVAAVAAVVAVS